ncbi:MAG: metalloregulator ArsR/SmtB family transcription factor [Cytophagaceae bacterium]|jgi:ArsR family transcriptional regulator|nr:metalloregulator ArsR/SmtB family transcription factor [Cytophagaceae bacterium]
MSVLDLVENKEKLEKAAYILKTIAHPTRLAVIALLEKGNKWSVTELCEALECEQSLLSHHLTNMRAKGLLKAEKEGQQVFYSLREKNLLKILSCIQKCDCNF